jgi:hypothetical protein
MIPTTTESDPVKPRPQASAAWEPKALAGLELSPYMPQRLPPVTAGSLLVAWVCSTQFFSANATPGRWESCCITSSALRPGGRVSHSRGPAPAACMARVWMVSRRPRPKAARALALSWAMVLGFQLTKMPSNFGAVAAAPRKVSGGVGAPAAFDGSASGWIDRGANR